MAAVVVAATIVVAVMVIDVLAAVVAGTVAVVSKRYLRLAESCAAIYGPIAVSPKSIQLPDCPGFSWIPTDNTKEIGKLGRFRKMRMSVKTKGL